MMIMNRRGFLKVLSGAVAGVAISEELADALSPKKPFISLPPRTYTYRTVDVYLDLDTYYDRVLLPSIIKMAEEIENQTIIHLFTSQDNEHFIKLPPPASFDIRN